MKRILLLLFFLLSLIPLAAASLGLGVSPSKINYTIEGGETIVDYYIFYNPGTDPITARISAEGDIFPFATIEPTTLTILPEPEPHQIPFKNGQIVKVTYHTPPSTKPRNYAGAITASGATGKGTYGSAGNVATEFNSFLSVVMRVTIYTKETQNFWTFLQPQRYLRNGSILFLIGVILFSIYKIKKNYLTVRIERPQKHR